MEEKRVAPRHRVLKAGTIEFGGGAIDCTVRNVSHVGAALEVTSPVGIPEKFTLVIPSDGLHCGCRVIYRRERRIGVKFD
ncbi:PilZ domain-containing protein [Bradyrhizobium canariense]|uniref:PilZ domain-containing protein n=1 Tax=Bradyrhizobium canariense TaxID=255045 RepID=A0A1H1PB67_9BRAD|nr:PilZ domain-containing protein [Bradyrhizobium canariense]SDS08462.1 PilZ domain-containing protein [Bradyrhizobium canariense]